MNLVRFLRSLAASATAAAVLTISGCATSPTDISSDTAFKPDEGLVAIRVIELGDVPITRFSVVSETTGEEYLIRPIQFGQTQATTYVGRLPAGRYHPKELLGSAFDRSRAPDVRTSGGSMNVSVPVVTVTVPLAPLTGKFDVQAQRVTELGTMVFVPIGAPSGTGTERAFSFALPLLPTPVPTDALLQARYPALAKVNAGHSALSWVNGTVPKPPQKLLDAARQRVAALTHPSFAGDGTMFTSGAMGVVDRHGASGTHRVWVDTPHAIEAVVVLKDGRWLVGGEEGFLALSADQG